MAKTTEKWLQQNFGVKPKIARPKLPDTATKRFLQAQQQQAPTADLSKRPAERFSIAPGSEQEQMLAKEGFSPQMVFPGHEKRRGEFMAEARHTLADPTKGELGLIQKAKKGLFGISSPELLGREDQSQSLPTTVKQPNITPSALQQSATPTIPKVTPGPSNVGGEPSIIRTQPSKFGHSMETMGDVARYRKEQGPNAQTSFTNADVAGLGQGSANNLNVIPAFDSEVAQKQTQNALMRNWMAMSPSERGPAPGSPEEAARKSSEVLSVGGEGGYGIGSNAYREARNRRVTAGNTFDDTVRRARNAGVKGKALANVVSNAAKVRSQGELVPEKIEAEERMAEGQNQTELAKAMQAQQGRNQVDPINLAKLLETRDQNAFTRKMDEAEQQRQGQENQQEALSSALKAYPSIPGGVIADFSAQFGTNPTEVGARLQQLQDQNPKRWKELFSPDSQLDKDQLMRELAAAFQV